MALVRLAVLCGLAFMLVGCDSEPASSSSGDSNSVTAVDSEAKTRIGWLDEKRLNLALRQPDDWLTGGRDGQQTYYSPLADINPNNVSELGFAWQFETGTELGFQSTPIVFDGRMYATGPRGAVYVLDASTGEKIWTFEPEIDPTFVRRACCGQSNRGLALWKGKVYVGSLDGYLYAFDAANGDVHWKVDTLVDRSRGYTITGAPYLAGDRVIIGNAGADLDARGYVSSYDSETGDLLWRFFTVPRDPSLGPQESPELETALETWSSDSLWQAGLGGTAWDGMAYDPELDLIYVGTGNGSPHPGWLRSPGGGDNLYLSSILAINAESGRLAWHYQTTPGDSWDYTATQKIILADLEIEGELRRVLMQAPKNGFFYVLDRITGELISAKPYAQVTWASGVDLKSGRPIQTDQGDYRDDPKLIFPGPLGAHLWHPMAYNPATGLVYLPSFQLPALFATNPQFEHKSATLNTGATLIFTATDFWSKFAAAIPGLPSLEALSAGQPEPSVSSTLIAWDPVNGGIAWGSDTSGAWKGNFFAAFSGGGAMTTGSGLVFQGRGDGHLVALDARTGHELHKIFTGTSLSAAPMTYRVGGEQYVAIMAGINPGHSPAKGSPSFERGNRGRVLAFKIGGETTPLPPKVAREAAFPRPPVDRPTDNAVIAEGGELFREYCATCHQNVDGAGVPNLLRLNAVDLTLFEDVVLKGILAEKGMGSFEGVLTPGQVRAIQDFLIDQAWEEYEEASKLPIIHDASE